MSAATIGLDIAKLVFQVDGADAEGSAKPVAAGPSVSFLHERAAVCRRTREDAKPA